MGLIFETTSLELVLGVLLLIWAFYVYSKSCYLYWKNRSFPYEEPSFPFGTDTDIALFRKPFGHHFQSVYMKFKKEKAVGMFLNTTPYLLVGDPELMKHVMTKDFNHFVDRGMVDPELLSPVSRHLFHMEGEAWKTMRSKLTPAFTSGKMKMMYHLIEACADEFVKALEPIAEKDGKFTAKDGLACFTTDVIATCAFGLRTNSIQNPDNEFRKNGNKIFAVPPLSGIILQKIAVTFPTLYKKFGKPLSTDTDDFFLKIIGDTVAYRERSGVVRNDFIDILIKIKNNKILYDDERTENANGDKEVQNGGKPGLTLEEMTAQAVLFFVAGFETSASTLSFCLYEISWNQDVQTKMRKEVDAVLAKHNGKPNYQALQEMTYMEAVINETLRRYSPLSIYFRQCTEDYKLPDLNLVVPKGMKVIIPIYGIHHDPEYYPDPYKFDPERFTDDKINTRHNYTFLPFGEGPRVCIGVRFAMMQMKLCLAMLLQKFEVGVTEDTPKSPIAISKKHLFTTPESPIVLKLSKRRD